MHDETRVNVRRANEATIARLRTGDWPVDECIEWPGRRNESGYGHCRRNGETIASRAVWVELKGPIPNGLSVCHRCDNPPCVNPAHLFLGTVLENALDMAAKGRHPKPRGERSPKAKVTDAEVCAIRQAVAGGETRASVARRYGLNQKYVSRIVLLRVRVDA